MDILPGIVDYSAFDAYKSGVSFARKSGDGDYGIGALALIGDFRRFKYSCLDFFQFLLALRLDRVLLFGVEPFQSKVSKILVL